jgi:hypothetical protein
MVDAAKVNSTNSSMHVMKKPAGTNENDSHPFTANLLRPLAIIAAAAAITLTTGCSSVTLFQSAFNSNTVGAAPAHTQATGTIDVAGAPGGVLVVDPPPGANEHWAKISRTSGPQSPISSMLCNFSAVKGPGTYSLAAAMFIPSGSGLATVEFVTSPSGAPPNIGFLHLDFMEDGTVRLDDDSTQIWGTYQHDKFFDLFVTLDITATTAVAHMSLIGSGTTSTKDYTVPLGKFAHQIGAVNIWMGSPWGGSFNITDIIVTKRTN